MRLMYNLKLGQNKFVNNSYKIYSEKHRVFSMLLFLLNERCVFIDECRGVFCCFLACTLLEGCCHYLGGMGEG